MSQPRRHGGDVQAALQPVAGAAVAEAVAAGLLTPVPVATVARSAFAMPWAIQRAAILAENWNTLSSGRSLVLQPHMNGKALRSLGHHLVLGFSDFVAVFVVHVHPMVANWPVVRASQMNIEPRPVVSVEYSSFVFPVVPRFTIFIVLNYSDRNSLRRIRFRGIPYFGEVRSPASGVHPGH